MAVHEALLAEGALSPAAYAAALAGSLGVPLAGWRTVFDLRTADEGDLDGVGLPARIAGRPCRVLDAESSTPDALRTRAAALQVRGLGVALAPQFRIEAALERHFRAERIDEAVRGLYRRRPASSAGGTMIWTWQLVAAAIAVGLVIGGLSTAPEATIGALAGVAALPFLCVTLLRLAALREVVFAARAGRRAAGRSLPALGDRQLPVYSVLVPLFREANVLADLVRALGALDYPRAKLEVLLILEECDLETQAALLALGPPPGFRTVIVPDGQPRTKPKALNYALQFARGEYVVVYDAEDRPQPDQLRRALDTFRRHPPDLGCVQAQLNIYNARASWFTRQFTVEYSALFDAILPALARLRPADAAGRHVEPLPARGARGRGRLGPVQRHRGCRSGLPAGAAGVAHHGAGLDHLGGGAGRASAVVQAAHPLAERMDADVSRAHAATLEAQSRSSACAARWGSTP